MRKLLWLFCTLGVVATLTQGLLLLDVRPLLAADEARGAFLHFPLDSAQTISFAPVASATERQRMDQLRDWLLLSVLADAGLTPGTLNNVTFDLPPVRDALLQPFGSLEYGETRSRLLDSGQVIALLPADQSAADRRDSLAHIFDQHHKDSGAAPRELLPFEYRIAGNAQTATITRRAAVSGAELLSAAAGYYTAVISDIASLEQFLDRVDDVTSAQIVDGKLELGGREIPGYRSIGSEEIAALWQSEHDLLVNADERTVEGSGFSLDWKYDYQGLQAAFREIQPLLFAVAGGAPLTLDQLRERLAALVKTDPQLADVFSDLQSEMDGYAAAEQFFIDAQVQPVTQDELWDAWFDVGYVDLPWIDTIISDEDALTLALEQLAAGDPQAIDSLRQDQAAFEAYLATYCVTEVGYTTTELRHVARSLAAHDTRPLNRLIDKADASEANGDVILLILLARVRNQYTYQFARYDGALAGTKAGMLLFYTDLLAKMWSFNYEERAPEQIIPNFKSEISIGSELSALHEAALQRLRSSRLWFEPDPDGYQVAGGDLPGLLFERNATRIVSLSSDPNLRREDSAGASGDDQGAAEEPADPQSAAFITWWDDHFEEVARYEPEYERLNQLMKWSIIIGWLNANNSGDALAFLGAVPVQHDLWFPDWVRSNPQLRFQSWDAVPFHERGYQGEPNETLALLYSPSYERAGETWHLRGGVSLASRRALAQASQIADDIPLALRRSYLEYGAENFSPTALRSANNVTFAVAEDLADDAARVTATLKPGTPLRSLFSEAAEAPFERTISSQGGRVSFSARSGETVIGKLEVLSERNGLRVGWYGLDREAGYNLANAMAWSSTPESTLLHSPSVQSVVRLSDDGTYIVKLKGSEGWLKIAHDPTPGEQIASGYQLRVGTSGVDGATYNLAWLDEGGAAGNLSKQGYLVYQFDDAAGTMPVGSVSARAPPRTALPVELSGGGATARGHFDPLSGKLYLEAADEAAGAIAGRLHTYDMVALGEQAGAGGTIRYALADEQGYVSALAEDFADGPAATARRISGDPAGYAARLAQDLSSGLERVDSLFAIGDDLSALSSLQRLEQVHGPLPGIRLRQGLAEIGLGRPDRAAAFAGSIDNAPLSSLERFFAEIRQRVDLAGVSPAQRSNYQQYAAYVDWRDSLIRQGLSPEQLSLASLNQRLQLQVMLKTLPKGEPWRATDRLGNAAIYVQDSPGLNNLDWATAPETAMQQVISGDLGSVVKLTGGEIADFNPTTIYITDAQNRMTLSLKNTPNWSGIRFPYVAIQEQCPPEQADCAEQPAVYIVTVRP